MGFVGFLMCWVRRWLLLIIYIWSGGLVSVGLILGVEFMAGRPNGQIACFIQKPLSSLRVRLILEIQMLP